MHLPAGTADLDDASKRGDELGVALGAFLLPRVTTDEMPR
jgi:hypothetical protein